MPRPELLQVAGEILAAQRNASRVLTKVDIAEIIETHLALDAKEKAFIEAVKSIENHGLSLRMAQRQAQQAERRAAALAERLEACYAPFSPAMDAEPFDFFELYNTQTGEVEDEATTTPEEARYRNGLLEAYGDPRRWRRTNENQPD